MNTFQPLGARCLVKPVELEPLSAVIIVPEMAKQKSDEGIILAMGTEPYGWGKVKDPNAGQLVQLKVGDRVLFQKYTGSEFKIGGMDCRVLAYDDILGVIRKSEVNGASVSPQTFSASPETSRDAMVPPEPQVQSALSESRAAAPPQPE
jgi:chaperonin GroES